jgi:putative DNA methylase
MDHQIHSPKKLIEVALPLDAINEAAAREKSIRHGHPSTLHLWWARRPLAAARAVIFSQLVHDPEDLWRCQNPGKEPNAQVKGHWTKTRARLFAIIEDLVKWENTTNEHVLEKAREEIRRSWRETCELNKDHPLAAELFNADKMPGLHDPFAGGGAIPLEAQRLGLEAYASDLNPVAVLINKAMIEIPPKFANRPPVRPESKSSKSGKLGLEESWKGAAGLAEDVRYYGQWMREEAEKQIGHLYPKVEITKEMVAERPDLKPYLGEKLTVIAWLWARTVKSPNPAFSLIDVPLATTFILSSKAGKEAYVQAVVVKDAYTFTVKVGKPPAPAKVGTSAGTRKGFRCVMSDIPIGFEYIREEGLAGRMGQKLMAIVAEGSKGRVYLAPSGEHEAIARSAQPTWEPETPIPEQALSIRVQLYGMKTHGKLFTPRQLLVLTTFSDLVGKARERIRRDAVAGGFEDNDTSLDSGGTGARAYSEAVAVYLAFIIDKMADLGNNLCRWEPIAQCPRQLFGRQSIPMVWDFAEANAFGDSSGSWDVFVNGFVKAFSKSFEATRDQPIGIASQAESQTQRNSSDRYVSTDPPYYDNIGYADLSDFFYLWLRRSLRSVFPTLLATIAVPKAEELVATQYRHGTKQKAEKFFLDGMTQAMQNLAGQAHPAAPISIYYAFKQSETASAEGTSSSGWVTFLDAVLKSGLTLTGTWPLRTENASRMISQGTNALASSIVLICRPRTKDAGTIDRRKFQRMLNETLPAALDAMTRESEGLHSPVAPVDLSQAIIGPGMAIFSRYEAVLEADGSPMTVKTALQLINRFLAEDDFDADTQFCLHWFEQYGWDSGKFGEADTLARAKGTSVDGVKQAGVLYAAGGNVRLLKWAEYPSDWDPQADQRLPIWEVLHQLIRVFSVNGETGAAAVFSAVQSKAEAARQLAYRLYTLCERKNRAEDARAYNEVVTSWSSIESAAAKEPAAVQRTLFDN